MKINSTNEQRDRLTHGLLRLSHKLFWIGDQVVDGESTEWILDTIYEATDDISELLQEVRRPRRNT